MIEYRGYTGTFEYDPELELLAGHVTDLPLRRSVDECSGPEVVGCRCLEEVVRSRGGSSRNTPTHWASSAMNALLLVEIIAP